MGGGRGVVPPEAAPAPEEIFRAARDVNAFGPQMAKVADDVATLVSRGQVAQAEAVIAAVEAKAGPEAAASVAKAAIETVTGRPLTPEGFGMPATPGAAMPELPFEYQAPVGPRPVTGPEMAEKLREGLRNTSKAPETGPGTKVAPKTTQPTGEGVPPPKTGAETLVEGSAGQPASTMTIGTTQPWKGATADDEFRWFGTKVEVLPKGKARPGYKGTVTRVLNGGDAIEVQPDGVDTIFRLRPDDLNVVEVKDAGIKSAQASVTQPPAVPVRPRIDPFAEAETMAKAGIGRQESWSRWIQKTNLNPGMDAEDWYSIYDRAAKTAKIGMSPTSPIRQDIVDALDFWWTQTTKQAKGATKKLDAMLQKLDKGKALDDLELKFLTSAKAQAGLKKATAGTSVSPWEVQPVVPTEADYLGGNVHKYVFVGQKTVTWASEATGKPLAPQKMQVNMTVYAHSPEEAKAIIANRINTVITGDQKRTVEISGSMTDWFRGRRPVDAEKIPFDKTTIPWDEGMAAQMEGTKRHAFSMKKAGEVPPKAPFEEAVGQAKEPWIQTYRKSLLLSEAEAALDNATNISYHNGVARMVIEGVPTGGMTAPADAIRRMKPLVDRVNNLRSLRDQAYAPLVTAKEPWELTKDQANAAVAYSGQQRIVKIGDVRTFYRTGDLPKSGRSYNAREGKYELGVSVYITPTAGSMVDTTRPWYFGKGKVIGFGGDDEALIKPIGAWEKYPGHKVVVERAISSGKPVPAEVLADYPDLAKKVKGK
jgi:hypothetical protein